MILSFFTKKSTRRAKLSSVFAERFSGEGQADFAINKARKVSLKGRNNLYISCVFNGFKYICFSNVILLNRLRWSNCYLSLDNQEVAGLIPGQSR